LARLVEETPPGRTVKAAALRQNNRIEFSVAPVLAPGIHWPSDPEWFRTGVNNLTDWWPPDFDFDLTGGSARGRLGVTVHELSPQLAGYFGAKSGVLVASVADDSPAARAGIRAGDVIASINGQVVESRRELIDALRGARNSDEISIGVVRDKKETTLMARLESPPSARPIRMARPA